MLIRQGQIFWVRLEEADNTGSGVVHPHVVIQDDVLNASRIDSLVVCALSTNMRKAKDPGNVFLEPGEANLPKQSVVVVSQVSTVKKDQLGEYIGALSTQRVEEILAGMCFQQRIAGQRSDGDDRKHRQ